jgi:hypothetical protein
VDSTSRRVHRNRAAQRGVSLIEGMTASVVMLIGLMGVFQGLIVASRQNAMANHATRASGVASQVRGGLDALGRSRVLSLLSGSRCTTKSDVLELAGGMESLKPESADPWTVRCILDFDEYELTAYGADRLLPGYAASDMGSYRRVLVLIERRDAEADVTVHEVTVVVSWTEMGQRKFARQYLGFYDPGPFGNRTNVEL